MKACFEKGVVAGVLAGAMSISGSVLAAECIAPANPGGGWDFTCRTIGKIMHDIGVVDKPIQVTKNRSRSPTWPAAAGGSRSATW